MTKKTVFSGVQPSGDIHIGNYLGAIKQFVDLQEKNECIFSIVDLHAITVWQDPDLLRSQTREVLAIFLACGIDSSKNIIFNQSQVLEHAQLAWILNCTAKIGWLNRMTQFKDKAGKNKEIASVGLFAYPVLMAADILLYNTSFVPVGDDQKQHLELARDIAHKFNTDYKNSFFKLPESLMNQNATRIMSLRNGENKMSKSDPSDYSRIMMTDGNDIILKKIMKAKSDPMAMPSSIEEANTRKEVNNLLNIFSSCTGKDKKEIINDYASKEISKFKKDLADAIITLVEPIASKTNQHLQDTKHLDGLLKKGADKARTIASKTICDLYKIVGMIN